MAKSGRLSTRGNKAKSTPARKLASSLEKFGYTVEKRKSPRKSIANGTTARVKQSPAGKKAPQAASPKRGSRALESALVKSDSSTPKYAIGTAVSKIFTDNDGVERPFSGEVTKYSAKEKLYHIVYEDDDSEDLSEREVGRILAKASSKSVRSPKEVASKGKYNPEFPVSKVFRDNGGMRRSFKGRVTKHDDKEDLYKVEYEDGNEEKMTDKEVEEVLVTNGKRKDSTKKEASTPKKPRTSTATRSIKDTRDKSTRNSPRRSTKKTINYREDSDEDEFSDDKKLTTKMLKKAKSNGSGSKANRTTKKKGKKWIVDDSDSEVFSPDHESDDEPFNGNVETDDETFGGKKGGKKKMATKRAVDNKSPNLKTEKKKMYESFQPMSNPIYDKMSLDEIKKKKSFLDPCGMEATDDIIDRLVGQQLDKIGNLLRRALSPEDSNVKKGKNGPSGLSSSVGGALGSQSDPLTLGTACSGTDAPALALMLVQEQLELRGMGDLFKHDHVFSCEVEPYKQAYIARNFDSVLYPDIVKLCDKPPRDVYGQEQPLPAFNLFVAGTSCKNFSMLMSNKRIDIEDKGCSGETFLAACELLFQEKPRCESKLTSLKLSI